MLNALIICKIYISLLRLIINGYFIFYFIPSSDPIFFEEKSEKQKIKNSGLIAASPNVPLNSAIWLHEIYTTFFLGSRMCE